MKIREIIVRNYKKFIEAKPISFCDEEGNVNDMNLILGENGSGKTSILQAIVATIAPLTRSGFHAQELDWNGFDYRFIQSGRAPLKIEIKVDLSQSEIEATQSFFDKLKKLDDQDRFTIRPGNKKTVTLHFDYRKRRPIANREDLFQLYGYQYAKQLSQFVPNTSELFDKVGSIFWYTENRNSFSLSSPFSVSKDSAEKSSSLDDIRSSLANHYYFHLAVSQGRKTKEVGQQVDFYEKLDQLYHRVFPNRHLVGAAPRYDEALEDHSTPDFFLSDGTNQYEISEMSAGERAIFPILMDFARYNINNSVIIIDEIELHLHSPLQQALIRALPLLGHNNQFSLTSHSDNVVVMFNEDEIIRL